MMVWWYIRRNMIMYDSTYKIKRYMVICDSELLRHPDNSIKMDGNHSIVRDDEMWETQNGAKKYVNVSEFEPGTWNYRQDMKWNTEAQECQVRDGIRKVSLFAKFNNLLLLYYDTTTLLHSRKRGQTNSIFCPSSILVSTAPDWTTRIPPRPM